MNRFFKKLLGHNEARRETEAQALPSNVGTLLARSRVRDGYVREAALIELQAHKGPDVVRACIERLNDYVDGIAKLAHGFYFAYLSQQGIGDLLACLDALLALRGKTRRNHDALFAQTRKLLVQPEHRDIVLAAMHLNKGRSARFLFELLAKEDGSRALILAGMQHADALVRACVLRVAQKDRDVLEMALRDRSASIRSSALRMLMASGANTPWLAERCRPMLLDAAFGPRSTARWYAAKLCLDVKAFYQTQLAREDLTAVEATALLWEAGKDRLPKARTLAMVQLGSAQVASRLAALDYLLRLDAQGDNDWVFECAWQDASPKVRKYVAKLVTSGPCHLSGERIYGYALQAWIRQDEALAKMLMQNMGLWRGLALALDLVSRAAVRPYGEAMIARANRPYCWIGYQRPSLNELASVRDWLALPVVRAAVGEYQYVVEGLKKVGAWPDA